jgi:hypothetical protein
MSGAWICPCRSPEEASGRSSLLFGLLLRRGRTPGEVVAHGHGQGETDTDLYRISGENSFAAVSQARSSRLSARGRHPRTCQHPPLISIDYSSHAGNSVCAVGNAAPWTLNSGETVVLERALQ